LTLLDGELSKKVERLNYQRKQVHEKIQKLNHACQQNVLRLKNLQGNWHQPRPNRWTLRFSAKGVFEARWLWDEDSFLSPFFKIPSVRNLKIDMKFVQSSSTQEKVVRELRKVLQSQAEDWSKVLRSNVLVTSTLRNDQFFLRRPKK
jgi:hypothetical protein